MKGETLSVWNEIRVTKAGVSVTLYSESEGEEPVVEDEWWMTMAELSDHPHGVSTTRVSQDTLERQSEPRRIGDAKFQEGDVVEDKSPPFSREGQPIFVDEVLPWPQVTAETYAYQEETSTDDMSKMESVFAHTVADANEDYPSDDRVVLASYGDGGSQYAFPESRLSLISVHGDV